MGVLLAIIGFIAAGAVILFVFGMILAVKLAAFILLGGLSVLWLLSAFLAEALGISAQGLFFFGCVPLAVVCLGLWSREQQEKEQARQREAELAAKAAAEAAQKAREEADRLRRLQPVRSRFDPLRRWLVDKLKD